MAQADTRVSAAETIVKVPQMAESISEGTLSSFTKRMQVGSVAERLPNNCTGVGDHVEQDEEIASIETDKVRISFTRPRQSYSRY